MTPHEFITKWRNSPIKERAAAQAHFLDLCELLGEPEPADVDPTGLDYGFEVGAMDHAHKALDAAVAAAYGWPADLPDDEVLARLFALNQERAAAGR